jgi:hypothetical protein
VHAMAAASHPTCPTYRHLTPRSYLQRKRIGRPRPSAAPLLVHRHPGSSGAPTPTRRSANGALDAAASPKTHLSGAALDSGGPPQAWAPPGKRQQPWEAMYGGSGGSQARPAAGGGNLGVGSGGSLGTSSRAATTAPQSTVGGSRPVSAATGAGAGAGADAGLGALGRELQLGLGAKPRL